MSPPELSGQTVVVIGGSAGIGLETARRARERFFRGLPSPIDHMMVTAGSPYYAPLADLDRERAQSWR